MMDESWQIQLFRRSIKKKEKLKALTRNLPIRHQDIILDLGCAQGILSYFLRQKGGQWFSADQDWENLATAQQLLKKNLIQLGEGPLPFKSGSFDMIACLDYLEHLEDDRTCLQEIHRLLKPEGALIIAVPHTGGLFLLNRLKPLLGLKIEHYGHKREGYSLKRLTQILEEAGFCVQRHKSYARFFSEFIELVINFFYIRIMLKKSRPNLRDGHIRPSTAEEFRSRKKTFRLYSIVYPVVWLFSCLDYILFFQRGYSLMVWAKRLK